MRRVVATGTFDLLHPGHVFYLQESRALGDHLYVIVARDVNVKHKPRPVLSETQRLFMVRNLKPVDHAMLGDTEDIFRPIEEIDPEIITLGYNQHFEEELLVKELRARGLGAEVVRIRAYEGGGISSSRKIMERILAVRCP